MAFRRGLSILPAPVDVFVKVDADTSFEPDYFARLLDRFAEQPDLGMAGGSCYELVDGEWQRIKVSGSHPRGASRAYRWALLDDVFALEPELGWDGVDEVMAELRGYRTAGFTDFGFRHHRKVGERDGRLRAGSALGRQAWYMGYRPSYLMLRALYRARENVASLAMVWGYAWSAASGAPRMPEPYGHPPRSRGSASARRHASRWLGLDLASRLYHRASVAGNSRAADTQRAESQLISVRETVARASTRSADKGLSWRTG